MQPMTQADVEQLIRSALEPLEREVKSLRAELEAMRGTPMVEPMSSPQPTATELPDAPVAALVPPERSDFARFLQRGLEQEQREYVEETEKAPEPKKGWNPFKR
jgi:hypothetical protein